MKCWFTVGKGENQSPQEKVSEKKTTKLNPKIQLSTFLSVQLAEDINFSLNPFTPRSDT